jgi:hypothetical protein
VLANKVGASTQRDPDAAEHDLVEFRTIELAAQPVRATFDEKHLRAIHDISSRTSSSPPCKSTTYTCRRANYPRRTSRRT